MTENAFVGTYIDEDDILHSFTIGNDLVELARQLPDSQDKYFIQNSKSILTPIHLLIQTRARAKGITSALNLMRRAHDGLIDRRDPISIIQRNDGFFSVEDGNSTVTVAKMAGWAAVPCIIKSPDQPDP